MTRDNLWLSIKSLAAVFEGNREATEKELAILEAELRKMPPQELAKLREDLVTVIGGLSRLEMRLSDR